MLVSEIDAGMEISQNFKKNIIDSYNNIISS